MISRTSTRAACALLLLLNGCAADGAGDDSGGNNAGVLPPLGGSAAGVGGIGAGGAGAGGAEGSAGNAPVVTQPIGGSGGSVAPVGGAGGAGGGGAGGVGGMAGSMATVPPDISTCPAAPAGASADAIAALGIVNTARLAAGAGCVVMVNEINLAAQAHCDYYAMNSGECTANPHNEVASCAGFTGEGPGDRMSAAGYDSRGGGEVMAFNGDPDAAIGQWINSVWHRIPILDPWTRDMGYGGADECDTIDFGTGGDAPEDTVVVYPYPGQTGLPTSFNGQYEGPMPPAPASGWPSSTPITLYARELVITEHTLTLDGDTTPIEHMWLTSDDPENGNFLRRSVFMYGNEPFAANTSYRVKIVGTYVGGALEREWTFTTGEASRMFGGGG